MLEKKVFELDFLGRKLVVEYGELGKQANAAVLVKYNDTAVFCATVLGKTPSTGDFFPLLVQYTEKMYADGKIPGGFLRREGRQSEQETLSSRVIDRTLRPLFPEGFRNDVQVINYVMSNDPDCSPEMTALFASSLALTISDIPFDGPVAGVIVGRVNGELVINPTVEQMKDSDINLTVSGTYDAINMIESSAKEVSEDDMLDAMMFAHENIKTLINFINEIKAEIGKEKVVPELFLLNETIYEEVKEKAWDRIKDAMLIFDKQERSDAIDAVNESVINEYIEAEADEETIADVSEALHEVLKNVFRLLITRDKIRPDGRKADEIRQLDARIDILPRTHGSALFTRGQTQSLSVTTLGAIGDAQIVDGLGDTEYRRFMLHYNFPQFAVGETGRYGAPGRREIGHGKLGEKALAQVIPSQEDFPYTIRVVSEILESNGSSSQASITAGCLSLMAAGVPIKAPVAGIAMGLISEGEHYIILTDIQGLEDHLGDMDFKVAGTREGITALQMDIKIKGINREILKEALAQAKVARFQILDLMESVIPAPREQVSKWAPKIKTFMINPDKIRDVIGAGGKTITSIIEQCDNVKIDIEQNGQVVIMHQDQAPLDKAAEIIQNLVREVEIGEIYEGKVTRVEKFGCFVELWPGTEGLCHISKLDHKRIEKVEDVCNVGDVISVKAMEYDDKGRLNLSRKDTLPKPERTERPERSERPHHENNENKKIVIEFKNGDVVSETKEDK